ncbi:MAG: glycerophosphodiester phosphodiesterase family protein [Chlamydiota bacterium]
MNFLSPKKISTFLGLVFAQFFSLGCHAAQIEVQGHRGSRGTMPENSLPSFGAAIEAGADVLELDLLVSKDGVIFIHHNFFSTPELCVYRDGTPLTESTLISNWTLEEIKNLDCGSKQNPQFPEQRTVPGAEIPTLQELFEWIQNSSLQGAKTIRLNLELKRDPRHPEYTAEPSAFAKKVVDLVNTMGFSNRVYYSSFDPEILGHVRALAPEATIGFIYNRLAVDHMEMQHPGKGLETLLYFISAIRPQVISPEHFLLRSAEDVLQLKGRGMRVIPWTVNDPARWGELRTMGVDGLITDYPEQLMEFLK